MGKILRVDLDRKDFHSERIDEAFTGKYLGGNGLAAKILYEELPAGLDPFSSENIIVFAVGPVTDTPVPGCSRGYAATKSPLTGGFFDSTFGGRFALTQKRTGFGAIAVKGRSPSPVYLYVDESKARILPADDLWGKTTQETADALLKVHGNDADVVAIGPAGEARVRFACISHQWKGREGTGGRGGIGAVLGSKNLKAVVVSGRQKTRVADADGLKRLLKECAEPLKNKTKGLSQYGTPILVALYQNQGALGTRNLQQEINDRWEAISAENLKDNYFVKHTSCARCPVACGKVSRVADGPFSGLEWKMPEYETIYSLGTMTDSCDLPFLIGANRACDLLGLDTVSLGVTIAFAIECYEKGILTASDTEGTPLRFGDPDLVLELIQKTAAREGIGNLLAEGSFRMADGLGDEAKKLLYGVRRLEIPGHSARVYPINAIGYATNTRGGSHHDHRPTFRAVPPDDPLHRDPGLQVEFVIRTQNLTAVGDSMTQCRFVMEQGFGIRLDWPHARLINAVVGSDLQPADLEKMGERIVALERAFNCREGMGGEEDALPYRVTGEPVPEGAAAGQYFSTEKLEEARKTYYRLRGWGERGSPTPDKLRELGLEFAIP
jgi:aldehyde:ferredoxin oxidoreductase